MKNLLQDLTAYNQWANARISGVLLKLNDAQWNLEQKSSFTTLRKTTEHIADCEYNWYKRINGDSTWEYKSAEYKSAEELLGYWAKQSEKFVTLLNNIDDAELNKIISYKNFEGKAFDNELYKILSHVMNHSTYHRGQLVTMLRGAGETNLISTDLIGFYRMRAVTV